MPTLASPVTACHPAAELAGHLDWAILAPIRLRQLRSSQEARFAQARYVEEIHRMSSVRDKPEDDYRAVSHVDERCTIVRWGPLTTGICSPYKTSSPPSKPVRSSVTQMLAQELRHFTARALIVESQIVLRVWQNHDFVRDLQLSEFLH